MRRTSAHCLLLLPALLALVVCGCATQGSIPDDTESADAISPIADDRVASADADTESDAAAAIGDENKPCITASGDPISWLDRSQQQVYQTVCGTVAWFDGFFGNQRYDSTTRETHGRIGLSGFWDERDGFDPKLRFRAKFALPALRERTSLIIGRGDEKDLIEERETPSDSIPSRFNRIEDDSFLIGLGYQRNAGLKRGFSFSVGAKVRAPPEPYVKAKYRRAWELSDSTLFQLRPLAYWRSEEGFGSTLHLDIDQLLTEKFMLRFSGSGNISEDKDVEGVAWNHWLSLYQALAEKKALSYHAFVLGETSADVGVQNYGVEVRYRRSILRKWLFLEIVSSATWPRFLLTERRELNLGIGAGIEMYFGPVPENQMR